MVLRRKLSHVQIAGSSGLRERVLKGELSAQAAGKDASQSGYDDGSKMQLI